MFLAPLRKTVRCRTISLSFSLPFFPSLLSFSPNNHFSFFSFPAKRTTTTTQFVLPSPLPPPPSRYLRLTDFFATFFHPCVFFPYPPLSFHLFFSFFFLFHRLHVSLPVSRKESGREEMGRGGGGQTSARVTSGRFARRERSKSLEGWIFDFSRWIRFLFPFFPFLLP